MILNHIGLVTEDIEKSKNIYELLGYELLKEVDDHIQNNKLVFLKNRLSNEVIELIKPLNEKSTVKNNVVGGLHHICYEVKDIYEVEEYIKNNNLGIVFTKRIKAPAFDNRNIIFVYLRNKTIVEFLEIGE